AMRVQHRIAKFAAFVYGARGFGRAVAGNAAGKGELREQAFYALGILSDIGVELAVRSFEISVGNHAGAAVSGTRDADHVEVVLPDDAVAVSVDEVQPGRGSPMAQEPRLDVLRLERLAEQRVIEEVDLADREIVGRTPVGVQPG